VDSGAVQLTQTMFHETCGVENDFWKFFGDAWLRSVVIGNDSMVLLLTSMYSVVLSDIAVVYIMIPCMAAIYALAFSLFHWVEGLLPRGHLLKELEVYSKFLNAVDLVEDKPALTRPRTSHAQDLWDSFAYMARRHSRVPRFYFDRISNTLQTVLQCSIVSVIFVRIACIFFGVWGLLLAAAPFILGAFFRGRIGQQNNKTGLTRAFVAQVGGVLLLIVAFHSYKRHVLSFGHLHKAEDLTEKFFWHSVQGLFYMNKSTVAWILKAVWVLASTIWLASCWRLSIRRSNQSA